LNLLKFTCEDEDFEYLSRKILMYHFSQMMQMRAIEPLPATRFNFDAAIERAGMLGKKLAAMAGQRHPFAGLEKRLLRYDKLPYLSLSRAAERQLLADLAIQALPLRENTDMALGLARAGELSAAGKPMEALVEATRVYEAGLNAFEQQ
jgi:hypothetical protein